MFSKWPGPSLVKTVPKKAFPSAKGWACGLVKFSTPKLLLAILASSFCIISDAQVSKVESRTGQWIPKHREHETWMNIRNKILRVGIMFNVLDHTFSPTAFALVDEG